MAKQDDNMTVLTPCMCGNTTPVLSFKESPLTHELTYFYKCEKCGLDGETCWPKESINLIPSWNNTIKIASARKKILDMTKKTL